MLSDNEKTNYLIDNSIGIGIGCLTCITSISIILFDMNTLSKIELYFIKICWSLPLTIFCSYIIGCGIADRDILRFNTNTFAILFLPILYSTFAYFSFLILIALYTSIHIRMYALLASLIINCAIVIAVGLDVWQRYNVINQKQRIRQFEDNINQAIQF